MRGTLEGTGSLCNRGRALVSWGLGVAAKWPVVCGTKGGLHFMCVWDVEGVGVVSIGSEFRVRTASRPAVSVGPSLATKSRIYEGGRPESPLFSSPKLEHLTPRRPLTSLSPPTFPKTKCSGLREGPHSKTELKPQACEARVWSILSSLSSPRLCLCSWT